MGEMMEPFAVVYILTIMFAVVFACGSSVVYVFFRKNDLVEQMALAGIFGMAQIFVTFFLVKTFFILGDAVLITLLLNAVLVSISWMTKK